ncbi:MAG: DUF1385 domain-containing protein [Lachnospiraceae bacterium]|nr:DUF1385 domain-containing protein [Lachnospiraceae bacterium]
MKSSGIGGQAVLEGVMMKNQNRYAVGVRKPDNQIEVKTDEFHGAGERMALFRLPVFRGMAAFVESLVLGIRTLTYSSGFYEEDEPKKEGSKAREAFADVGVAVLSLLLAVIIFILLPLFLSGLIGKISGSGTVQLLIEGVLRVAMFVAYVAVISKVNDIKRVFMYHGAEHKCINCVEQGEELTVANVRRQSRRHRRCGTSFLLVVMLVSFVLFMFIRVRTVWLRYALRIVLIPFIAGVSYEFIRLAGNSDSRVVAAFSRPGLWLQGLTTKEPDDSMIEIAIISVELVFDWRGYQEKAGIARPLRRRGSYAGGRSADQGVAAFADRSAAENGSDEEGLAYLDQMFEGVPAKRPQQGMHIMSPAEEAAAWEGQEARKKKARDGRNRNTMSSMSADGEEDDEILRALDKFFRYDGEKTVMGRSESASRNRMQGGRVSFETSGRYGRQTEARAAGDREKQVEARAAGDREKQVEARAAEGREKQAEDGDVGGKED